jgi:hypothetical protein
MSRSDSPARPAARKRCRATVSADKPFPNIISAHNAANLHRYHIGARIERALACWTDDKLLFRRRSRLWHQEPHDRGAKEAYRRHTQKCCRPIKIRGDQAKECSAERSTNS